jgi:glycogen operon protein
VVAHDGFTLHDLVSYNEKHNEANGEKNRDGADDNESWNHGVEGPTDDPAIAALRTQQKRNMLATLLFSHGTPMILGGDEFGRTQGGNNNAYCQDNEISWFDWGGIDDDGRALTDFARRLVAFRKAHPVLRRTRFLHGMEKSENGVKDITWIHPSGREMTQEQWHDRLARVIGVMLNGQAGDYHTSEGLPADDDVLLILMNAYQDSVPFILPKVPGGMGWRRLIDTGEPEHVADSGNPVGMGEPFDLPSRSLVLFSLFEAPPA